MNSQHHQTRKSPHLTIKFNADRPGANYIRRRSPSNVMCPDSKFKGKLVHLESVVSIHRAILVQHGSGISVLFGTDFASQNKWINSSQFLASRPLIHRHEFADELSALGSIRFHEFDETPFVMTTMSGEWSRIYPDCANNLGGVLTLYFDKIPQNTKIEQWIMSVWMILSFKSSYTRALWWPSVADLRGRKGCVPPWGSKFFQFHAVFWKIWQNLCWRPPPPRELRTLGEILDPPLAMRGTSAGWQMVWYFWQRIRNNVKTLNGSLCFLRIVIKFSGNLDLTKSNVPQQ